MPEKLKLSFSTADEVLLVRADRIYPTEASENEL